MDLFTYDKPKFKFRKDKIRLVELFAGYGSQAMAWKRLIDVEHVAISEWHIPAIIAYAEVHGKQSDKLKEMIKELSKEQIIGKLMDFGLSFDDKKMATYQNYNRKSIEFLRNLLYCNILSFNLGNVENIRGGQLNNVDMLTYSFPCQDLSKAGKQQGLGIETRSGLVFEVIRILKEMIDKPKMLLMENVPDLLSSQFRDGWTEIYNEIENMGYKNHVFLINAKDQLVAQNRNRVFMLSVLGDFSYEQPKKKKLVKRLKDYLESVVDEKYFLTDKLIKNTYVDYVGEYKRTEKFVKNVNEKNISSVITTKLDRPESPYITQPFETEIKEQDLLSISMGLIDGAGGVVIPEATKKGYDIAHDGDGVYINRPHQKRGVVQKGMIQTLKTSGVDVGVVVKDDKYKNNYSERSLQDIEKNLTDTNKCAKTLTAQHQRATINGANIFEVKTKKDGDIVYKTQENDRPRHRIYNNNNNKVGFTLTTNPSQQPSIIDIKSSDGYKPVENTEIAPTQYAQQKYGIKERLRIRKLTPREALRLMDVAETDINKILKVSSDTQAYKLAGNSIVVNVLVEIFKGLLDFNYIKESEK